MLFNILSVCWAAPTLSCCCRGSTGCSLQSSHAMMQEVSSRTQGSNGCVPALSERRRSTFDEHRRRGGLLPNGTLPTSGILPTTGDRKQEGAP
jgi:hypothetical protein